MQNINKYLRDQNIYFQIRYFTIIGIGEKNRNYIGAKFQTDFLISDTKKLKFDF